MEGDNTPSVSSQVEESEVIHDEMLNEIPYEMHAEMLNDMSNDMSNDMPEVEKIPSYVENTPAEAEVEAEIQTEAEAEVKAEVQTESEAETQEKPQVDVKGDEEPVFVDDLRRIAIYSDDGNDSLILASYTSADGTKRFVLNTIDIPLTDFHRYLRSLTETDCNRHDELFFVGIHASFMTGLVVLLVAFGLTLVKTELPYLSF